MKFRYKVVLTDLSYTYAYDGIELDSIVAKYRAAIVAIEIVDFEEAR